MPPQRSQSPHDRSPSPGLPSDVTQISERDYFIKISEFRVWLREEKGKYFDELSGEKARSYFRKFVKAWNRGKLSASLYAGIEPSAQLATDQTAYKWSFASKSSRADEQALRAVRTAVGTDTYGRTSPDSSAPPLRGPVQGPVLPSSADLVMSREAESERKAAERDSKRKRERAEDKERVEEMVGPKEPGREGMLEKKRVKRDQDKAFRERGDEGFVEADESTLMGGGDSFREHLARRDASRKRFEQTRREEKTAANRDRVTAIREKDKATMDMFQQLAKQRFG